MPFPIAGTWPIPTKDVLSWIFDEPNYDLDKPIFVATPDTSIYLSHRTSRTLICQLIAGLKAIGLKPGDCVCIHSFNSIYYPILVLSIIGAGGIFAGTNPSYTSHELSHALRTARVRFLLAEPELLPAIEAAMGSTGIAPSQLLVLDTQPSQHVPATHTSWRSLTSHGSAPWLRFDSLAVAQNTTAALFFSSGTTGLAKAVTISHHNLVAQHTLVYAPHPRAFPVSAVFAIPLFHIGIGPLVHTSQLREGRTAYIMRRFELEPFLRLVAAEKVTEALIVPPIVNAVVQSGLADPQSEKFREECSLRSLRHGIVGGAPPMPEMQRRFQELMAGEATLGQLWGMTELTCIATQTPPGTKFQVDHIGSVGWPIPNLEIKLISDSGRDISSQPSARGELCVRGPTVTRGYFGNETATREAFDEEGFFKSGDIAYRDATTGLFYIVDRKKELIKVRGFQVAPPEVEAALMLHPGIADAGVIGVEGRGGDGEVPRAYVVRAAGRREGDELTEEEVRRWVAERLARYKAPEGGIRFVDALPRVPSGKILKNVLRRWAEEERKQDGPKL